MIVAALVATLIPAVFWPNDPSEGRKIREAGFERIFVPDANAAQWRNLGIAIQPSDDLTRYTKIPAPATKMRANAAAATSIPWVDANGWRFRRGVNRAFYSNLPPGSARLAAAEAHAYGVDAVLTPDPNDLPALRPMLAFLGTVDAPRLPAVANIGVVDDGSPLLGEVLNLLGRRNLLYRVVSAPDSKLDLNVRLGSKDFPNEAAANPNDFAARVREKLTDDKRALRIYGSYTVLGNLTADSSRARLYLLNYSKSPARDVHVRVLGPYKNIRIADSGDLKMKAADFSLHQGGTEFTIPVVQTYTIVDLEK